METGRLDSLSEVSPTGRVEMKGRVSGRPVIGAPSGSLRADPIPALRSDAVEISPLPGVPDVPSLYPWLGARRKGTVLLETNAPMGGGILAWDPVAVVAVHGAEVELTKSSDVELPPAPRMASQVPGYLQEILSKHGFPPVAGGTLKPSFLGGFIGMVGYEWATGQEGPKRPTQPGVPDLWFGLYDRAVILSEGRPYLVVVPSLRGATTREARSQLARASIARQSVGPVSRGRLAITIREETPRGAFEEGVREVRRAIRRGDVYQVNISQRIRARGVDPWPLYTRLKGLNPSPYAALLSTGSFTLASSSPERLLQVGTGEAGRRWATTRPIAGTRPRAAGERDQKNERLLRRSPKERAEHIMLVDLSRNDLGRVSVGGSVEVDELFTVERYSHVMHLVSNVRGRLREEVGVPELFRALMPGGSVTGTPKIRATEIISSVEPIPRGAYTGSLGYLSLDGSMDFNLLIRSAFFPGGGPEVHLYSGSGIVQDSEPAREWRETREKAAVLVEALQGPKSRGYRWAPPRPYSAWHPPRVPVTFPKSRVLLIDNYDSFTYNLVQYLSALGAGVAVVRNDAATLAELQAKRPTHVVISPGPGGPSESGLSIPVIRAFEGVPLLGVCLGLQAIAEAYGGTTIAALRPVHGKTSPVKRIPTRLGTDILKGLPPIFLAGRYHSLVVGEVPASLLVTARSERGEVMALQHRRLPTFGVQFHPESLITEHGMEILANFLALSPGTGRRR